MLVFETVVALLLSGAALAGLARRFGAPYPARLALTRDARLSGITELRLTLFAQLSFAKGADEISERG